MEGQYNCSLSPQEVLMELGSSELQKKCNNCSHFVYEDGIMTCDKISQEKGDSKQ